MIRLLMSRIDAIQLQRNNLIKAKIQKSGKRTDLIKVLNGLQNYLVLTNSYKFFKTSESVLKSALPENFFYLMKQSNGSRSVVKVLKYALDCSGGSGKKKRT